MGSPQLNFEPPPFKRIVCHIAHKLIEDMEPPIILNSNKSESLCCVLYINDLKIEQNVVIISRL